MKKIGLWIAGGLALSAAIVYLFLIFNPASFPSDEQVLEEMNNLFPEGAAHKIQDNVFVDDRHVLVPFVSEHGDYGISYWEWKGYKWKVARIDTSGEPNVWKVDEGDPSTYHIVWNMHPKDSVKSIAFYMIRERYYSISEGVGTYDPEVQMEKQVSVQEHSYGVMKLPEDWRAFLEPYMKVEAAKQPDPLFSGFFPEHRMYFGWTPYDANHQETFPEGSVNGHGFTNGNEEIDFVRFLDESDLEHR